MAPTPIAFAMDVTSEASAAAALVNWSFGYCVARGYELPSMTADRRNYYFSVGRPDQRARIIVGGSGADDLLNALALANDPGVFVEFAGSREAYAGLLPTGWTVRDPAHLMGLPPSVSASPSIPGELEMIMSETPGRVEIALLAADGEIAARGAVGVHRAVAVYDRISTEPSFRRRGLGSLVMRRLVRLAGSRGATRHLLIATPEGRALYERLGWTVVSEIVSMVSPQPPS